MTLMLSGLELVLDGAAVYLFIEIRYPVVLVVPIEAAGKPDAGLLGGVSSHQRSFASRSRTALRLARTAPLPFGLTLRLEPSLGRSLRNVEVSGCSSISPCSRSQSSKTNLRDGPSRYLRSSTPICPSWILSSLGGCKTNSMSAIFCAD